MAWLGFYLTAFVQEARVRLGLGLLRPPPAGALALSALGATLMLLFDVVFFAIIWAHVGSRLVGSRCSLTCSFLTAGASAFLAGSLALLTLPLMILSAVGSSPSILTIVSDTVQSAIAIFAVGCAMIRIKSLNGLPWFRTIVVLGWGPAVLMLIVLVLGLGAGAF